MRSWSAFFLVLSMACTPKPEAPPPAPPSADAELDRLDTRVPVPLLPMMANHQKANMRDHLEAVQAIVTGLAREDYAAIELAAGRIGFSEQMGRMCTHLGAGAPGFSDQAITFHRTADRIGLAAKERDRTKVLNELSATLQTCTACHATWKQRVVDDAAWAQLGSPSHGH
jgi:hypothetical protein